MSALLPDQSLPIMVLLAQIGGATTDQIQRCCLPTKATRTVQALLTRLEQQEIMVQHHQSQRIGDTTRRLASIWELAKAGRALVQRHDLAPPRIASIHGRSRRQVIGLTEVVVQLLAGVPDLVGLAVAHQPPIVPGQRSPCADALLMLHHALPETPAVSGERVPWFPMIRPDPAYRHRAFMVEIDAGMPPHSLHTRAAAYAEPARWTHPDRTRTPIPLWVSDGPRQRLVVEGFGHGYRHPWLLVSLDGMHRDEWICCTGDQATHVLPLERALRAVGGGG